MINAVKIIIMLVLGYLFGCINSSIILTRLIEKKDVRDFGSGNAGFTNTLRNFKKRTAMLVFAGDALKAAIVLVIAIIIAPDNQYVLFAASIGVVIGHNFPVFYGFKGGKGILVSSVAVFFADWRIGLIIFVVSVLIMFITKYVSVGSLTGSAMLILLAFLWHRGQPEFLLFSIIISSLSIYMHRENIKRLAKGTENRFGRNKA